jgi:hypothetical protein
LKGASRRTFNGEYDEGIFPFASRVTHLFPPDSFFILHRNGLRNIGRSKFNRKLDNALNEMLVTPKDAIKTSTYDNIDFAGNLANVEISGVIKKTTQLPAMACILLNSLTLQKGVLASSRTRA